MDTTEILRTALAEHDDGQASSTLQTLQTDVEARLKGDSPVSKTARSISTADPVKQIAAYSEASEQLSMVSFRCMLQDTGYPMEVYMPASEGGADGAVDMSKLRERWVGWAVE